jgi:hypothetical protein
MPRPDPAELAAIPERRAAAEKHRADLMAEWKQREQAITEARDAAVKKFQGVEDQYTALLKRPPPEFTGFRPPPEVPDIQVRPWLVPTGQQNLSTILQGLSALAVGVAGAAVGAPRNALQYFYNAAESWRQDQIDQGNAAFKNFQTQMAIVKNENDLRSQIYDVALKRYGANQVAAHAAVVVALEEVGQHDAALKAASTSFERQLKGVDDERKAITDVLTGAKDYEDERIKIAELAEKLNKPQPEATIGQLEAERSRTTDPKEQARLDHLIQAYYQREGWKINASKSVSFFDARIKAAQDRIDAGHLTANTAMGLMTALDTIRDEAPEILRQDPREWSKVVAWFHRQSPEAWKNPKVAAALGTLEQFLTPAIVQFERGQMGVKGNIIRAAFGEDPEHPVRSINEMYGRFKHMLGRLRDNAAWEEEQIARDKADRQRALEAPIFGAAPAASAPSAAPAVPAGVP